MKLLSIDRVIQGVGSIADELHTSKEEKLRVALEDKRIGADLLIGQHEVNKAEAQHKSIFVAGWRPAIGWVGALALGYQFLLYPMLVWAWSLCQAVQWLPADVAPPPILDTAALWTIITGMLGIAGMRSYDKRHGTQTEKIKNSQM